MLKYSGEAVNTVFRELLGRDNKPVTTSTTSTTTDETLFIPESKGFDSVIQTGISNLVMKLIQPWFNHCLSKYTEDDFHQRIANGFQFRDDWLTNHREKYHEIIARARRVRWALRIDTDHLLAKQVSFLHSRGWTLTDHEIAVIRKAIEDVKADIAGDHPLV